MSTAPLFKSFDELSDAERTKFNKFHSVHYDLSIIDSACKTFMNYPDPDFICCLSSKLSYFIQSEVIPLINNLHKVYNYERENKENPTIDLENN